ncbi:MAG TPA: GAF domain-containing protein [Devosia sp.]|jgi:GAF domain-containing protein
MSFSIVENEEARLRVLTGLGVLDTEPHPAFDALCQRAATAYAAPIALISFVDRDRQWFKSRVGLTCDQTDREFSFCSHAILRDEPLMISDATKDPRFSNNPLVTGAPFIRFYAGAPLFYGDQIRLGTLCIVDTKPRSADQMNLSLLQVLADEVAGELWVHHEAVLEAAANAKARVLTR